MQIKKINTIIFRLFDRSTPVLPIRGPGRPVRPQPVDSFRWILVGEAFLGIRLRTEQVVWVSLLKKYVTTIQVPSQQTPTKNMLYSVFAHWPQTSLCPLPFD